MKKAPMIGLVAGVLTAALLAGAVLVTRATAAGEPAAPARPAEGSSWVLKSWSDPAQVPDTPITLEIADGMVRGNSACNTYTGPVTSGDGTFKAGPVASTMMYCLDTADAETIYLGLLQSADSWAMDGDEFVLSVGGHEALRFTPAI